MDSDIIDTWIAAEGSVAMATNVVDGAKFVTVERIIKMGDATPEMAVMPFARGDELDRLIAALQRARGGAAMAKSSPAVPPETNAGPALSLSDVLQATQRLFYIEGRSVLIGVIIIALFVLFVGGR
jgi:hypothetical protein